MSDNAKQNIVNLGDFDQKRRGLGSGPGTQALREVRDLALDRLEKLLGPMMETIDDTLFARAEKAESNAVQMQYFDAMREMRIVRKNIEQDFLQGFTDHFNQGCPRETASTAAFSLNFDDDNSIGLIDKNDVEEDLAISNMVNKARGLCKQSLYSLDKRIGFLINDPDLERWRNPVGPETLCDTFKEAVKHVETGLEIRLVVLKLFDQHVICRLDDVYKALNQRLVQLGIMPEIKATIRKSTTTVTTGVYGEPVQGGTTPVPEGEFAQPGASHIPDSSINTLTFLQQGGVVANEGSSSGYVVDPVAMSTGHTNILHDMRQAPMIRDMGKAGDTTIDIVAMMFDYILDDRSVPDAMRSLIGRLQIPVLKVALLDKSFFSRKSHPARLLLNRLAETAMQWTEQEGDADPFYQKVATVVQTILDDFEDDIGLFETVLEDFENFLDEENARAELRATRSARAMEGEEKIDIAKTTTLEEIEPRINTGDGVEFVRDFVSGPWKNLLFIICARQGKDSDAWNQAVATMDDLIWSVKPKRTVDERKRLVAMQPVLLGNLRAGMERLSMPATERDDFIARLVHAHGRTAVDNGQEADSTSDPQVGVDTPAEATDSPAEASETEQVTQSKSAAGDQQATDPVEPDTVDTAEEDSISTADAVTIDRLKNLTTGTWLEFLGADGKPLRAKLSWISPITNTYLFTDRAGLKAGNYSLEELAQMVGAARARIIDDKAPLMDRAVGSVLSEYGKKI